MSIQYLKAQVTCDLCYEVLEIEIDPEDVCNENEQLGDAGWYMLRKSDAFRPTYTAKYADRFLCPSCVKAVVDANRWATEYDDGR